MNNFDMSSTGENIELNVTYDYDLATINFDDFLNGASGENCEKIKISHNDYFYLLGDSSKPFYKKSYLAKINKSALFKLAIDYDLLSSHCEQHYTKSELINELLNIDIKKYYEFIAYQYRWHDLPGHFKHDYYLSRGYCQGDAVYVVSIDLPIIENYIDNLFWDCPVYIYLSVNDNNDLGYELLDDNYSYDKNEVVKKVNKLDISQTSKEWIIENLPEYPVER